MELELQRKGCQQGVHPSKAADIKYYMLKQVLESREEILKSITSMF